MKNCIVDIKETTKKGIKIADIELNTKLTVQSDLNTLITKLKLLLETNQEVNLFTKEEAEIDISFMQIIHAAKTKADENDIVFNFNLKMNQVSKELIKLVGLENIFAKNN